LSKGWLEGDDIICGYHGFRYCPEGSCVKVPTQNTQPARARVKSYPVMERAPLVWIWTGDPALSEGTSPPEIPWLNQPEWRGSHGYMKIAANYMLLKENVLDLTHFGYVHRKTFKIFDWNRAPEVTVEGNQVEFKLDFPPTPLAPVFQDITGFGSRPIARVNWGRYLSPALQHAGQDFTDPSPAIGARANVSFRVLHATTPVDPTHMHYFWFFAFDLPLTEEQITSVVAITLKGFAEDDEMISAVQDIISRDPRGPDYPEVMVATDRAAVQARRLLQKQMASEQPTTEHSAPSPAAAETP